MNKQQMYPRLERTSRDPDQLGITVDMLIDDTGRCTVGPEILAQIRPGLDDESRERLDAAVGRSEDYEALLDECEELAIEGLLADKPRVKDNESISESRQQYVHYGACAQALRECAAARDAIRQGRHAAAFVHLIWVGRLREAMYASQFIISADCGEVKRESMRQAAIARQGGMDAITRRRVKYIRAYLAVKEDWPECSITRACDEAAYRLARDGTKVTGRTIFGHVKKFLENQGNSTK